MATLDRPALKKLAVALETLRLLGYPRDRWLVVVNRADSLVGLSPAEAQAMLEVPITALIPSSREVPASVNRGVPLAVADRDHPVSLVRVADRPATVITDRFTELDPAARRRPASALRLATGRRFSAMMRGAVLDGADIRGPDDRALPRRGGREY